MLLCVCAHVPVEGSKFNSAACYLKSSLVQSRSVCFFFFWLAYMFESVFNEKMLY